ncbi:hypothetical protein KR200_002154 [Drosophila serrata]|nr:hypothetical protein KR200_002154 [Drosophila serrata]
MEIAPLINNAVAVVTASATVAASASASANVGSSKENDNVNNLALLASLTLQKVLNINNNNSQHNNKHNHNHNSNSSNINKQLEQQKQQKQRRNLDNKSENDVLNQLLKTGAVFTKTATPTAPIAIEKRKVSQQQHQYAQQQQQQQPYHHQQQQQFSAQKQRLNSSISSTHSSTSTNSSYGSSSSEDAAATSATSASLAISRTSTTKASSIKLPEKSKIPSDILDDLASRFIINVPDMELNNLIRICFQVELAHWFYLDFFCAPEEGGEDGEAATPKSVKRKLPTVGIKQFAMQLFQHIPFLNKHHGTVDQILDEWKNYKLSVPTYGAILVSEDYNYCLLVQSYFARNSWGFPKGKINENEDPAHCATREVYEETGFDITDNIDANDYIEAFINYQYTRLYVVRNIPLDTPFAPRTRNEIKCCDWFRIDALPVNKNDAISKAKLGKNSNSFFMIMPFVKRLKKWVNDRKAGIEPRRRKCSGQHSPKAASPTNHLNGSGNSCKKDTAAVRNASRRQRHKSMGDLDGVKLNNLNGKAVAPGTGPAAAPATAGAAINSMNICNSNGKRNKQNAAAGSNQTTPLTTTGAGSNGAGGGGGGSTISSKRQLFHSQSQNDAQQSASTEKIVSSFDLIRKEKQLQQKAAKALKQQQQQIQQQQQQQQQRSRTKSQSDKQPSVRILGQQQQQQPTTGVDLIAMLSAAAAAAQKNPKNEQQQQQPSQSQQRPRPASVSLNFGGGGAAPSPADAQGDMHKLQRMASGTNLRILKRAQSQQPQQQQQQLIQQQQQPQLGGVDFTPNFNSWTNFSFTKNFIANVFC